MQLQSSLRHESRRGQPGLRGGSPGIAIQNREAIPAKGWAKCDVSLERGDDYNPKLRYENAIQRRYLVPMKPPGPLKPRKPGIANVAINRIVFITSSFRRPA
jgi:hypothetical protein